MAKIPQGILGGLSGRIGGVIGSSWKGINVVKTRPLSVANPRTVPQVKQRNKFSSVVKFGSEILADFIKPYWDRFAVKQSGYNAFVAKNVESFDETFMPDPSKLILSEGKMSADTLTIRPIANGDRVINFEWVVVAQPKFKAGNDLADQMITNSAGEVVGVLTGSALREDLEAVVPINPPAKSGNVYHCYLVNRRPDGTIVSQTAYASKTVV